MIKKILFTIAAAFFSFFSMVGSNVNAEIPNPNGDIYIQDFSNVLTEEEKGELIDLGRQLDSQTKAQIAVLTVPTLDGQDLETYANDAFRKYQLGDKKLNNGVLLLLVTNDKEHQIRIEVGYGLEGALPDGKVGRILDNYALPYLKENKIDGAIVNTYKKLFNEVAKEYHLDDQSNPKPLKQDESKIPTWMYLLIAAGIVLLIIIDMKFFGGTLTYLLLNILSMISRNGGNNGGGNRGGGGGSSGGGGASRNW